MKKAIIILSAFLWMTACNSGTDKTTREETSSPAAAADLVEVVLNVDGMTCDGCEQAIQKNIETLEGIASVESSHEEGWTKVSYDRNKTTRSDIETKITGTGYIVKGIREDSPAAE